MAIETNIPSRENPGSAQGSSDAITRPSNTNRIEAKETDTDVPDKETKKPASTVTGDDGVPVPNPDEERAIAEGRSAQSDG